MSISVKKFEDWIEFFRKLWNKQKVGKLEVNCIFQTSHTATTVFFFYQFVFFYWSDCKSPQVSRTLLSILVDLESAVVWIVLILPLISSSRSLFPRALRISLKITVGITVILLLLLFNSLQVFHASFTNHFFYWNNTGTLGNVKYSFFFITPKSTLTQSDSTC